MAKWVLSGGGRRRITLIVVVLTLNSYGMCSHIFVSHYVAFCAFCSEEIMNYSARMQKEGRGRDREQFAAAPQYRSFCAKLTLGPRRRETERQGKVGRQQDREQLSDCPLPLCWNYYLTAHGHFLFIRPPLVVASLVSLRRVARDPHLKWRDDNKKIEENWMAEQELPNGCLLQEPEPDTEWRGLFRTICSLNKKRLNEAVEKKIDYSLAFRRCRNHSLLQQSSSIHPLNKATDWLTDCVQLYSI